jgi:tetratricopeptide (TPR) repeat protein
MMCPDDMVGARVAAKISLLFCSWAFVLSVSRLCAQGPEKQSRDYERDGVLALQQGSYALAERQFRESLKLNPGSASAHSGLAIALRENGDPRAAIEEFQKAVELNPKAWEPRYLLGQTYVVLGELPEAIAALRAVLQIQPGNADALYNLALAEWKSGQRGSAVSDFRSLVTLQPQDAGAHFQLGKLLRETGDRAGALTELQAASALQPQNLQVRNELAWTFVDLQRFDDATEELQGILQLDESYAPAHYALGVIRELTDAGDRGVSEFREAIRLQPDFAAADVHLARVLVEQRKLPEAIDVLESATRLAPHDPGLHLVWGLYFKNRGDPQKALNEFRESLQLAPRAPEAHYESGLILRQMGKLQDAAGEFRKAIELSPTDGPSLLNLAQILALEGHTEESQRAMRKFAQMRKDRDTFKTVQLYNDTGIRMVEEGDLNAGIGYFRAAVELSPDSSEMHRNLAKALFRADKLDDAGKEYETATRLNPQDWQAHCGLGEVLAQQNHVTDAIKEVETGTKLNPRSARAFALLARLYQRANDPARAKVAFAHAKELERQVELPKQPGGAESKTPSSPRAQPTAQF